jgi:aromatic ring-opening dioxygenase LigB subunit
VIEICFKPASHWPASQALIGRYTEGGPAWSACGRTCIQLILKAEIFFSLAVNFKNFHPTDSQRRNIFLTWGEFLPLMFIFHCAINIQKLQRTKSYQVCSYIMFHELQIMFRKEMMTILYDHTK